MSHTQEPTPTDPAGAQREITVTIPADRVESFERFVQRFLSAGEHPRGGRCRGRKPGGRHGGRHVHVHLHG